jgi:uncharacterized protein
MKKADWQAVLAGPLDQALPRIEAAARYGLVDAQLALAQIYLDGRAGVRNAQAALGWFAAAAASGAPMALNMLGRCHEMGWGTPQDSGRAASFYARAARQGPDGLGLDWAQFNLGMLTLRGRGVQADRDAARHWFRKAAAQGHAKAMNMLGMMQEQDSCNGAARQCAARWYRAAAEGGDFRGQFNLATLLAQSGDMEGAASWFRRALQSGNPDIVAATAHLLENHAGPELRAIAADAQGMATASAALPPPALPG